MDIVYVVKDSEYNLDLKYSLRSLINATGYDRIFMVGYKPSWVSDSIGVIPTVQSGNKWENSFNNILTACKSKILSEDIILFNDDFFAINPVNLSTDLNWYRNTLDEAIAMYAQKVKTRWIKAHAQTKELLESLGSEHFMNFALHIPMIINRKKFVRIMNNLKITEHLKKYKILSFRSIYGNLDWKDPKRLGFDSKPTKKKDIKEELLSFQWLSVFDMMTENLDKFPNVKSALSPFLEKKCEFEK